MKTRRTEFADSFNSEPVGQFAPVYYYLFAGITLLVAVFLFLPRVAMG